MRTYKHICILACTYTDLHSLPCIHQHSVILISWNEQAGRGCGACGYVCYNLWDGRSIHYFEGGGIWPSHRQTDRFVELQTTPILIIVITILNIIGIGATNNCRCQRQSPLQHILFIIIAIILITYPSFNGIWAPSSSSSSSTWRSWRWEQR